MWQSSSSNSSLRLAKLTIATMRPGTLREICLALCSEQAHVSRGDLIDMADFSLLLHTISLHCWVPIQYDFAIENVIEILIKLNC